MRSVLSLLMFAIMLWLLALGWFVGAMPTTPLPADEKADAIIVLTGGSERVEHGLAMLAEQVAPVLFISGVGEDATEAEILDAHTSQETREKIYESGGEIVLDHIARSTVSNADQSREFIKTRGIKTIRLVTADYHMRRALLEFRLANPDLTILADPVFPARFRREAWWQHDNSRRPMLSEFYKYYIVLLREVVRPTEAGATDE